jgi:outer membrane protein OmpA-like peptidoglycan-associated protein
MVIQTIKVAILTIQKLSQDRANAVKTYLVSKGVVADTITATGYGETKPIVKNDI